MRTGMRFLALLLVTLLVAAGCSWSGATRPDQVVFTTLERGYYSGITERKVVLITDQSAWANHWRLHMSHVSPAPALPQVDFSKNSVLAIYMGEQRSGGYDVTVTDVSVKGGTVTATVHETVPAPGSGVVGAHTQPHHLVLIPRAPANAKVTVQWQ